MCIPCVFDLGTEGPELELRGISLMWVLQIKFKSSGAAAKSEPVSHPPAPHPPTTSQIRAVWE